MKAGEKQNQLKISSLDFFVAPLQISIKSSESQQYLIQFDKGAQILKKFEEQIHIHPAANTFHFSSIEQGKFRLQNQRACACEWGLYRSASDEMTEFVDSLAVNLLEHYTTFANSLKNCQADYLRLVGERTQGKDISRLWDSIKERCHWEFQNLVAKNRSNSIELRYRLQIRCEADAWAEAEKRKSNKSLKTIRSFPDKHDNTFSKANHEEYDLLPQNSIISPQNAQLHQKQQKQQHQHALFKEEEQVKLYAEETIRIHEPPVIQVSKKGSVLSDIIERSQQSSNFNDREKRNQLKQISDIPEEENEMMSPHLSTYTNSRTQNFQNTPNIQEQAFKRRSNTFGSNHNRSQLPEQIERGFEMNRDEQLGKEQYQQAIETLPQSEITHLPQEKAQLMTELNRGGRAKYVIVFIFSLIFIGALAFQAHFQEQTTTVPPKKVQSKVRKVQQRRRKKGGKE